MADADVRFGFDTSPFRRAMRTVAGGMGRLARLGTGVFGLIGKAVTSTTGKLALLGGAFLSVRALLKGVPEIGQAFSIAGDIFRRNFFEPIRRALLPLLQQLLDWVRDNRARFVRWGQAVVSAFQTVIIIARKVFEVLQRIGGQIIQNMRNMMGIQSGDFADFINLLTVKVVALVLFMGRLIGRFFDQIQPGLALLGSIGDRIRDIVGQLLMGVTGAEDIGGAFEILASAAAEVFNTLTQVVDSILAFVQAFGTGFFDSVDRLGGLRQPLQEIWDIVKGLLESLGLLGGAEGNKALEFFERFGAVVGAALMASLNAFIISLRTTVFFIQTLIDGVRLLLTFLKPGEGAEARQAIQATIAARAALFSQDVMGNLRQIGEAAVVGAEAAGFITAGQEPMVGAQQGVGGGRAGEQAGRRGDTNIEVGDVIVNVPPGTPVDEEVGNQLHGRITDTIRLEGE